MNLHILLLDMFDGIYFLLETTDYHKYSQSEFFINYLITKEYLTLIPERDNYIDLLRKFTIALKNTTFTFTSSEHVQTLVKKCVNDFEKWFLRMDTNVHRKLPDDILRIISSYLVNF